LDCFGPNFRGFILSHCDRKGLHGELISHSSFAELAGGVAAGADVGTLEVSE
jgi:hypothetical protein